MAGERAKTSQTCVLCLCRHHAPFIKPSVGFLWNFTPASSMALEIASTSSTTNPMWPGCRNNGNKLTLNRGTEHVARWSAKRTSQILVGLCCQYDNLALRYLQCRGYGSTRALVGAEF
eukprot:INCI703.5.p1 GENE.INCI703.5~~INCI703.5.p1  ORF type:complete len:118 (-),score=9.88 INCI703.5:154-507(-)